MKKLLLLSLIIILSLAYFLPLSARTDISRERKIERPLREKPGLNKESSNKNELHIGPETNRSNS